MKTYVVFFLLILFSYCSVHAAPPKNTCPVILVHGFSGWGPEEMEGYNYWGGRYDLRGYLEKRGFDVYVASVGPFSSNWDRAVELFYNIRGGQVDYGEDHSLAHNHTQRPAGRVYDDPLYPQWNAANPVHLIGHSMGGQTVRMLSALMVGKTDEFRDVLRDENGALFTPGEGWIKTITTIAAPHNGSSLFSLIDERAILAATILTIADLDIRDWVSDSVYDFDLDQWNLEIADNETLFNFIERVEKTLGSSEDFSFSELSPEGARAFNERVNFETVDPTASYFSYSNQQTFTEYYGTYYYPSAKMNIDLRPFAYLIGFTPLDMDPFGIGPQWRENDGVVNTFSMTAPLLGCNDTYAFYNGQVRKGIWNYMGKIDMDHTDISSKTRFYRRHKQVQLFYEALLTFLTLQE